MFDGFESFPAQQPSFDDLAIAAIELRYAAGDVAPQDRLEADRLENLARELERVFLTMSLRSN